MTFEGMGCAPRGTPNPDFAGVHTTTATADGGQVAEDDDHCDKQ